MTTQIYDKLLFDGQVMDVLFGPNIPVSHGKLELISIESAAKTFAFVGTSVCWRNYVATWTIRNDTLFLCNVKGIYKIADGEEISADWFSGSLLVPKEAVDKNDSSLLLSKQETELLFDIKNGSITRNWYEAKR